MHNILDIQHLHVQIRNKVILRDIQFSIQHGSFIGIIGPNGAGKSTLIRAISRLYPEMEGEILLNAKNLRHYSRKELAQFIGVVPAELYIPYDFSVRDIVRMGRTPYTTLYTRLTAHDEDVVSHALAVTDCLEIAERLINSLSSGEKQRALIAQALAQEPALLLLDEPTAHLDINHQKEIMDVLWHLNQDKKLTIVMVSHDVNCAAEYCSDIMFLKDGMLVQQGKPGDILDAEHIGNLYGTFIHVASNPVSGNPHVYIVPKHVKTGDQDIRGSGK